MFVENFVALFTESAPFLLVGMLIAGIIHQFVPVRVVERALGKNSSVLNAALIGAPLPLCSCSVIPVAMGIRRSGASKASTASFLVATPETGVDSIGITYALMGPLMAVARPVAAVFSAVVTGSMIKWFAPENSPQQSQAAPAQTASCCASEAQPKPLASCCDSSAKPATNNSCCDTAAKPVTSASCCDSQSASVSASCCASSTKPAKSSLFAKITAAFTFGYGQLLRDFMLWLMIGLFFAAAVTTLVPADFLAQYGQGVLPMLLVVLVSIPMYVCATASTPIAVGLLLSGITPGAALVFMLTGPATNIATLMVIKKELGGKELVLYLISITVSAVACGLLLDLLFSYFDWQLNLSLGQHEGVMGTLYQLSALILAGLIFYQVYKKWMPQGRDCCEH